MLELFSAVQVRRSGGCREQMAETQSLINHSVVSVRHVWKHSLAGFPPPCFLMCAFESRLGMRVTGNANIQGEKKSSNLQKFTSTYPRDKEPIERV